jgi:hypothetical protein
MRVVDNVVAVLDANRGELSVLEGGLDLFKSLSTAPENMVGARLRGRWECVIWSWAQ